MFISKSKKGSARQAARLVMAFFLTFAMAFMSVPAVSLAAESNSKDSAVVFLGTFVAFTLFLQGVKDVGGVRANLLGLSEPVSATIFSWWLLGSALGVADLIGFALMISMVVIVTLNDAREAQIAIKEEEEEESLPRHPSQE